ncbi:MAG: hypothetical protein KF767_10270 [Bdellovibrionaceae bacterium]|nr:hypothetical protein [Pseudobdellovibrionaceae bacterium]
MQKSFNVILGIVFGLALIFALHGRQDTVTGSTSAPTAATASPGRAEVSATPQPLQRRPSQARPANLEDFLRLQDPQAEWTVHRDEAGTVTGFMGGRLPLRGRPEAILSSISSYLIGQSPEFREAETASVEGPLATTRTYRQMASGYEVYGAAARVSVNHGEDAATEVSSDLRKVQQVDTTVAIELREAEARLRDQLARHTVLEVTGTSRPLVFGRTPEDNELAWQFRVVVAKPGRQHREILLSARDGRILLDRSVVRH